MIQIQESALNESGGPNSDTTQDVFTPEDNLEPEMSTLVWKRSAPISSGEIPTTDPERIKDIESRHQRVSDFLKKNDYDALLVQNSSNFAWLTAGGDNAFGCPTEPITSLFLTHDARVVVTTNIESGRIFDIEIPGLGFQLKERPWHQSLEKLFRDLCHGRRVASDTGFGNTDNISSDLSLMRRSLSELDVSRMRELGKDISHAVEATARQCLQGQSESDLAGEVAHRLIKRQITALRIQVSADGQNQRYRLWGHGNETIGRYCTISAVGSRHGLSVGATRTVCFGEIPKELLDSHQKASLILATGRYFSQNEWEISEIWKRIIRIYEKFGHPDEWQQASQADIIGYDQCELTFTPDSKADLTSPMAVHWHPSIGPALVGDTILITEKFSELLTPMETWPKITIKVKGRKMKCPAILCREPSGEIIAPAPEQDQNGDTRLDIQF